VREQAPKIRLYSGLAHGATAGAESAASRSDRRAAYQARRESAAQEKSEA
jgi:hypothetical protein